MDGMTYPAKVNTSNGHIEIEVDPLSEDDIVQMREATESTQQNKPFNSGLDRDEKAYLANKFFELGL